MVRFEPRNAICLCGFLHIDPAAAPVQMKEDYECTISLLGCFAGEQLICYQYCFYCQHIKLSVVRAYSIKTINLRAHK